METNPQPRGKSQDSVRKKRGRRVLLAHNMKTRTGTTKDVTGIYKVCLGGFLCRGPRGEIDKVRRRRRRVRKEKG